MRNGVMWKLISMNFFYQMAIATFVTWLPTLLKNLMNTGMANVGWLALLPYIGTMSGMLAIGALSDITGRRRPFVILSLGGFALSLLLYLVFKEYIWFAYACLVGVGFFLQAAAGVFWTIPSQVFPANVAGGARGVINALGNLGGFVGPFLVGWFISAAGSTDYGLAIMVAALLAAIAITYRLPRSSV
jgi:MFS family permease